jgi:hypothetical protein
LRDVSVIVIQFSNDSGLRCVLPVRHTQEQSHYDEPAQRNSPDKKVDKDIVRRSNKGMEQNMLTKEQYDCLSFGWSCSTLLSVREQRQTMLDKRIVHPSLLWSETDNVIVLILDGPL